MSQRQLNESEWAEWLLHPTTKLFRELLRLRRTDLMETWAEGGTTSETEFGTVFLNGQAIGACKLLKDLFELDHDRVNKELSDE